MSNNGFDQSDKEYAAKKAKAEMNSKQQVDKEHDINIIKKVLLGIGYLFGFILKIIGSIGQAIAYIMKSL